MENHFSDRTKGGLQKVAESYHRDQFLSQNVERVFEVVAVPDLEEQRGYWKTTMDVRAGDKVIVSYFHSLNSKVIKTKDEEYRLIVYYGVIAKVKGNKPTPINGYFLFTPILFNYNTNIPIPKSAQQRIDYRVGNVAEVSKPNKYYTKGDKKDFDKGINISKGDKVVFLNEFTKFAPPLEVKPFITLDKEYYYCHRHKLGGKIK